MEYTGERFVPSMRGDTKYEHYHRYAVSLPFVTNKDVLDIASGEGYGSACLARNARSVIGVDIDRTAIVHSNAKYSDVSNLIFKEGACENIPLETHSVDVVTSFETIEHHHKHEEMLNEVKRVLRPGGIFIVSSPNRTIYSEESGTVNPFHVRELNYDEFAKLLSKHFRHYTIYGQRYVTGSFLVSLSNSSFDEIKAITLSEDLIHDVVNPLKSPVYFVAFCSDQDSFGVGSRLDSILWRQENDDGCGLAELNSKLVALQQTIAWMQNTKIWKLRKAYLKCLRRIYAGGNKQSKARVD